MKADLQEARPFAAHAPDRDRPLGGYALLTSAFLACAGGFSAWLRRSNRQLPERVTPGDVLVTSGIDGLYPAGVPVARVNKVDRRSGTAFLLASCTPMDCVVAWLMLAV